LRVGGSCLVRVARDHQGGAHEAGKVVNVLETVGVKWVFGISYRVANAGGIGRLQPAGYPLLVHVSIGSEREQAGLLVLPAKPSSAHQAVGFRHRHLDELPRDPTSRLVELLNREISKYVAVNGFYETVTQRVGGSAQGDDVLRARHFLYSRLADGAIVDQ